MQDVHHRTLARRPYRPALWVAFFLALSLPSHAYVDPGVMGILMQIGYVIFYGLVGAFAFLGKPFQFLRRKSKPEEEKPDNQEKKDSTAGEEAPDESKEETAVADHSQA